MAGMAVPPVKALAEAQVAGAPPAALVDAGLLQRNLAVVPAHPIQLALTPAAQGGYQCATVPYGTALPSTFYK